MGGGGGGIEEAGELIKIERRKSKIKEGRGGGGGGINSKQTNERNQRIDGQSG